MVKGWVSVVVLPSHKLTTSIMKSLIIDMYSDSLPWNEYQT